MRHCATGRHRRHGPRPPIRAAARSHVITLIAALIAALTAFFSVTGTAGAFASAAAPARVTESPVLTASGTQARAVVSGLLIQARAHAAAARSYTVRPGDSLSAIALRLCGVVNNWTGIYEASRAVIGPDPNVISAGQRLTIRCTDPPALLRLGSRHAIRAVSASAGHAVRSSGFSSSVVYSYAGLEQIWQAAGGPSWAAPVAACIAEHESGGRPWAVSPTNDYGLWQINGSHGALATLNALGNARAAVIISSGGRHWAPWTTRPMCGAAYAKITGRTAGITLDAYTAPTAGYIGGRILDLARTRLNDGYAWGGTGPSAFDCSGLVYWAAGAAGERNWPRDTYGIAAQIGRRFAFTSHPERGDLAMWGPASAPSHVEIVTIWSGVSFGAENPGWAGRVTWHSDTWFRPSFYLRILW
jgi:hypothetical protein